jgi:hypothetical protein
MCRTRECTRPRAQPGRSVIAVAVAVAVGGAVWIVQGLQRLDNVANVGRRKQRQRDAQARKHVLPRAHVFG